MSYTDEMPSVLLNPVFLTLLLGDITIPVSRKYKEVVATRIATTT